MKDNCSADQGCDGGGLGIIQSALRQLWLISIIIISGFTYGSADKESTCNVGNQGSIPRSGRFPGEGNGNPLQYFCLENSRDRGAGQAEVHGIAELDMTVRLTVTFTAPPQIIKHQISDVGDPCSRAHTSRSPWRGCFIPCLVFPRGGGALARLHCCAAQGSRSQCRVHCLCTWAATAVLNWVPCAGFCTQPANLRCWRGHFQPSIPVWSARFKASAYDSQWVSDIQLSIKGKKKK